MKIRLEVKLADLWVGAFWQKHDTHWHLWICLLPCLPIHVTWPVKTKPRFVELPIDPTVWDGIVKPYKKIEIKVPKRYDDNPYVDLLEQEK